MSDALKEPRRPNVDVNWIINGRVSLLTGPHTRQDREIFRWSWRNGEFSAEYGNVTSLCRRVER